MTSTTIDTGAAAPSTTPAPLLRAALKLDAAVTGANGAAYLVAAGPLGDLLGLSPTLLRWAGAFLLTFAAGVWLLGGAGRPARALLVAVIAANGVWALDSAIAAAAGWGSPTVAGTVWIALQAAVVAGFAALQAEGLRRAALGRRAGG